MAKFSEVLTIVNGKNQKSVENPKGKYPIYGSGGVMGYADDYICNANTIIIGRKGNINNPIYVETPFWNVDTAFGLDADENKLFPKYLYYFCVRFDFEKLNTTVTIPSLTKQNLLKIEIPLPPLETQKQIAANLDKVTHIIELCNNILEKLDLLVKARFVEMFGDLMYNPFKWDVCRISDISTFLKSGLSRKLSDRDIGIPCIRSCNIQNGQFDYTDIKYWYLDDPQGADTNDYILKDGDILINFINSNSQIGKVCIFSDVGRNCIYTTNIFRMILNAKCDKHYFNYYAMTEYYKKQLQNIIQPAVNQSSFTTGNYLKLYIPVPPIELQHLFATFVKQTDKSKSAVKQVLEKAETLKKALMQEYFG